MPVQRTYPGVYIEEITSGVRTIMGVSTSITAFIGRAKKGKPDTPLLISTYSDYERMFGGLWVESTMSYVVRDFFLNGGSQAIIIRIHKDAKTALIPIAVTGSSPAGSLELSASSPGIWGNKISVKISLVPPSSPPISPPLFNLKILYDDKEVEQHLNVNLNPNYAKYLPNVLANRSDYLMATTTPVNDQPVEGTYTVSTLGDDGTTPTSVEYSGAPSDQTGLNALYKTDIFNLLCIPPPERGKNTDVKVYSDGLKICVEKRAMMIVDPQFEWGAAPAGPKAVSKAVGGLNTFVSEGINGDNARNAMLYFPLLIQSDQNKDGQLEAFVPCGTIAGVIAKTDATRGIWKSAAGLDAGLSGVRGLQINLNDSENGSLNILGINCLRTFPVTGSVVWGARTMRGADQATDEYKYACVRRTALYIEESLYRGSQWVVFEPNDEPLWSQIRLSIGAFMHNMFRQGAFQGQTPRDAYLVKCDKETTTQNDINMGVVNILVGFAPLKPAEFVIIKIQQLAGKIES